MLDQLRNTFKNSFLYSIGNMAGKLSGIILLPLYTKFLPIEEFGLLALLEITYLLILSISGFGIKSSLMRFYWDKDLKGREKSLFYTSYLFNVVISLLTIFAAILVLKNFSVQLFNTTLSRNLFLAFISSSLIRMLVDTPILLMRIQQKAFRQTSLQIMILVISVGLTVYLIGVRGMGIESIFLAQLVANLLALLILGKYIFKSIDFKFDRPLLRELLQFGIPLFLSNLLSVVLVLSDRFILNYFGTLENVGNFSLAFKISNIIQVVFVASFMNAYTHIFYKQMTESNAGRFYSKTMTYFVFVIVFVSIGLTLFAKETINVLSMGNQDYLNSYTLIPVLVLGVIFGGIRQILILPLSRLKKTRIISTIAVSAGFLNFGLNLLLIPRYSSIGAAISTTLTQILASVWLYVLVKKHDTVNYELPKIFKLLFLGVAFYLLTLVVEDFALLWRLVLKALLYISFFFILYIWKFYEEIELERMKGAWKKWMNLKKFRQNISEIKIE
jgi:O-antigen/teichoic acid export membrane protein